MQAYRIQAVLFDFDGTLTEPGALDFQAVKRTIGCPPDQPVLEHIHGLQDKDRQAEAHTVLHAMELAAARQARPNDGVRSLLHFLKTRGVPIGILTRNSLQAVATALEQFDHLSPDDFDVMITRDDPVRPKPYPDGVRLAAERFAVAPRHILIVGDFHFDIEAGRRAGALTALLEHGPPTPPDTPRPTSGRLRWKKWAASCAWGCRCPTVNFPATCWITFSAICRRTTGAS